MITPPPANNSGVPVAAGSGSTDRFATSGGRCGAGCGFTGEMNTTPARISADSRIGTVMACQSRLISSIVSASIETVNSPSGSHCVSESATMTSCVTIGWLWIA